MQTTITLPGLQSFLDHLPETRSVALANSGIERLFGFNDVALARIERFERGHNCIVTRSDGCVVFQKMPTP